MKIFDYKLPLLAVTLTSLLLTGCSSSNKGDEEYHKYPHGTIGEYYNTAWKQGNKAIKDAAKPTIKNPVGITNSFNDLSRSKDEMGIPSQGDVNILVVPVTFLGDSSIPGLDLNFSTTDINNINQMYFAGERNNYPSVKEFYKKSSYGKLNIDGVVAPVVEFNKDFVSFIASSVYGNATIADLHAELVDYVYTYLFETTKTYYIGDFDSDNDRRVDSIQILVNYPLGIQVGDLLIDQAMMDFLDYNNVYFHKDNRFDSPVNSYTVTSEYIRKQEFKTANASHIANYLIGRCLGIENYNDSTGDLTGTYVRAPLAYKDIMDGYVGDHNSFSKYLLGWISPNVIDSEDLTTEDYVVTLEAFETTGDALLLKIDATNPFGEYLLIDLYSGAGNNAYDKANYSIFSTKQFDKAGIRVYQVDASLVRGANGVYTPYNGLIDLEATTSTLDGKEATFSYDFKLTNNGVNDYYASGITDNNPLISLLDKNGLNRYHLEANDDLFNPDYANDLLFYEGDTFATEDQIDGFYHDFKFHNNKPLGIEFEVDTLSSSEATIKLWRAE